jgi:hypothetical protein
METIEQCSASEEAHGSAKSRQQQALPSAKPPTTQSRGRPQAGFAHLRPPLTSNVRPQKEPS